MIVRGRYFDGGLVGLAECSEATIEMHSTEGKVDADEGKYPDYISLEVSDDEVDETLWWDLGIVNRDSVVDSLTDVV